MSNIRAPSLLAALLEGAALRITSNKPLTMATDEDLVRALNTMATKFKELDSNMSHGSRDTPERILDALVRNAAELGMDWWVGSSDAYSNISNEGMLLSRLSADLVPEYLTRLYICKETPTP